MIFGTLNESNERGELLLVDGGMCHWHLRLDKVITIREIIVQRDRQGQGIGRTILEQLIAVPGAIAIRAKCPEDLPANGWYRAMGFEMAYVDVAKSGKRLFVWELALPDAAAVETNEGKQ